MQQESETSREAEWAVVERTWHICQPRKTALPRGRYDCVGRIGSTAEEPETTSHKTHSIVSICLAAIHDFYHAMFQMFPEKTVGHSYHHTCIFRLVSRVPGYPQRYRVEWMGHKWFYNNIIIYNNFQTDKTRQRLWKILWVDHPHKVPEDGTVSASSSSCVASTTRGA